MSRWQIEFSELATGRPVWRMGPYTFKRAAKVNQNVFLQRMMGIHVDPGIVYADPPQEIYDRVASREVGLRITKARDDDPIIW